MVRRTALDIKKRILEILKNGAITPRDLETKINTNNKTIQTQLKELEFFGRVKIETYSKSEKNGRAFSLVKLKA
jgi:predicted transcriptional regulator